MVLFTAVFPNFNGELGLKAGALWVNHANLAILTVDKTIKLKEDK